MYDIFRYWHFKVAEAYAAGDMDLARAYCAEVSADPAHFDADDLRDQALRLVVARHDNHRPWLMEAEAALARRQGSLASGEVEREAAVVAHHLCGLMRGDAPDLAAAHFSAALALAPDFLPAQVELEILRNRRPRQALFAALGAPPPREDWRYLLAASELGLDIGRGGPAQRAAAICLRGLCTPQTPALVRLYRALNPEARIIVATWEQTSAQILEALGSLAEVVLVPDTDSPGVQNRNRQILLAQAALGAAQRAGLSYALLARADIALFQPDVLSQLLGLLRGLPVGPGRLLHRIVVPDLFTRRFMPFHISDIMSFGAVADLMLQWATPLGNERPGIPTEQYVHWSMSERMRAGPVEPDMDNYRAFLSSGFVVRDFDWFGGFWIKHPELRNGARLKLRDSCISQSDWERLYYSHDPGGPPSVGGASLTNGVMLQSALGVHKFG